MYREGGLTEIIPHENVLLREFPFREIEIGIEIELPIGQRRADTGIGNCRPGFHRGVLRMVISDIGKQAGTRR